MTSMRLAEMRRSATGGRWRIASLLRIWAFRRRSRAQLAALPPDRLHDIGLTPGEAAREAVKPFWLR